MTTLSETSPAPGTTDVVLEAEDLTKHFPVRRQLRALFSGDRLAVHAVDDVNLLLRRGRVTALVGESGSGKSTVARLLAQLYPRTGGAIRLHGEATTVRGGRRFRAYSGRVQMIFQDPFASLNPVHTVRYHLTRALRVHGRVGRGKLATEEALADLLRKVQLTPPERYIDKFPHELSGGQRQRVAIARALAAGPEALLADEPVSMLDVSIRLGVLNLLAGLREREGLAILYVTHDIASARYLADVIAVMYAGQIIESGPAAQVTDAPAHPYTQLLLSAAPDPDRAEPPSLRGRGAPPNLIRPPSGCRFHPRCPFAMAVCAEERPAAIEIAPGHTSACWLHAKGLSADQSRPLAEPPPQQTHGSGGPGEEK
ncbi:MAG TPA: ABC transporter ATP-binding protein [Actinocrinis sp.]|uniref:ABC transporter ATP-binding protein n=1 Tax=Actinocrinis sp. TaxID=1920516 RepID=UPI002DDCEA9C|nr:ABC transporter ATP-binding protein [Actinocrinis sp.]HEV2345401.1 ABC transporter ATP-binding protein [Actinocrinis sp.]